MSMAENLVKGTTHALVDQQERMDAAIHPEADRKIAAEAHLESCTHKHTEDIKDEVYALRCTLCNAYATKDKVWVLYPETDPTGRSASTPGAKLDAGKVRMGLVLNGFSRALLEVGKVGTFGAKKYSDNGWMEVPNGKERYNDAMLRHQMKQGAGETHDPDSGLLHAAHKAWNALAELELILRENKE